MGLKELREPGIRNQRKKLNLKGKKREDLGFPIKALKAWSAWIGPSFIWNPFFLKKLNFFQIYWTREILPFN